jgi:DNA-binding protein YbaB
MFAAMTLADQIAAEIADRLEFALGAARKVEIERILRQVPAFGDQATLQDFVLRIVAEAQRVAPTVTKKRMAAISKQMRAGVT